MLKRTNNIRNSIIDIEKKLEIDQFDSYILCAYIGIKAERKIELDPNSKVFNKSFLEKYLPMVDNLVCVMAYKKSKCDSERLVLEYLNYYSDYNNKKLGNHFYEELNQYANYGYSVLIDLLDESTFYGEEFFKRMNELLID